MAVEPHSGGEGIFKFGGVDWNATNVSVREEVTEVEITNTSNWDPTDKTLYFDRTGVKRKLDGTASLQWDALNAPSPTMRANSVGSCDITFPNGKHLNMPSAMIKGIPYETGGMDGIYTLQIEFGNKGKYNWI
jgi:hypothetical protein